MLSLTPTRHPRSTLSLPQRSADLDRSAMNHSIIFILILTTMTAFSCSKQSDGVTYRVAIPDDYHLVPTLATDDKWFSSLVGNLAKRANEPRLNYSVWRMTNIPCSVDGRDIAKAVYARDGNDNRFLVWTPECAVYHRGRPWLISWDHGMAYETNPATTSFYFSPSGRYIIAISPSHYGATYSKGQIGSAFSSVAARHKQIERV